MNRRIVVVWMMSALLLMLLASACSGSPPPDTPPPPTDTPSPATATSAPPTNTPPPPTNTPAPATATPLPEPEVDFSDPASVMEAVFTAAQTGDFALLSGLCDPLGENDGDTTSICAITTDHPDRDSFVAFFASGKVTDVAISDDRAEVSFLFGPDGNKEETMVMVERDGRWYLLSF